MKHIVIRMARAKEIIKAYAYELKSFIAAKLVAEHCLKLEKEQFKQNKYLQLQEM